MFFDLVYLKCPASRCLKVHGNFVKWDSDPTFNSYLVIIRLRHEERQGM